MKKIASLLVLALIISTCLMACGKQAAKVEDKDLDLTAVYDKVIAAQEAPESIMMFEETYPELIEGLYPGLSDVNTEKFVLYTPPITGFACEICMVKVVDEKDLETVKRIFQARIDSGISGGACDEEVAELWKDAQIQEYGKYAAMIVLPPDCVIPENIFTLE